MNDIMEGEQYMFDKEEKYNKINDILEQCKNTQEMIRIKKGNIH